MGDEGSMASLFPYIYHPFHEKPYTKPLFLVKKLDNFYSTNLIDFFFN